MISFIWIVTLILVVLALISGAGDVISFSDMIGTVLWCTWAPAVLGVAYQLLAKNSLIFQYLLLGMFLGTAGFAFFILSSTAAIVLTSGSLNESGMILMMMPFGFIKFGFLGSVCGVVVYTCLRYFASS